MPTVLCVTDSDAEDWMGGVPEGVELLLWSGDAAEPGLDRVDMLVPGYTSGPLTADQLRAFPGLRVLQLLSAGVESWLDLVPEGVVLANGRGIHGASTAELAVAGMLAVVRDLPRFRELQLAHEFDRPESDGLDGSRVLVVGAGDIGRRVGQSVAPLGADVTYVARRARDGVRSVDELPELLPRSQVVVLAIPHTPQTERLVDAPFLAAMPDRAVLVNVSRGALVDTDALLAELRSRRLRAFLDVTDPEPLPADHPLWDAPNLLLTPHVGGGTRGWERRAYALVRAQVQRLHTGQPLENVVAEGY